MPSRAADFYEAVFGWTLRRDDNEPAFTDTTGHVIGHFVSGQPTLGDDGPRPFIYLNDLDEAMTRIAQHGGQNASAPRAEGTLRVATFHDPEGNLLGIWTETKRRTSRIRVSLCAKAATRQRTRSVYPACRIAPRRFPRRSRGERTFVYATLPACAGSSRTTPSKT
jgi:predicted enzyme related to lactoylglutathione lyase